MTLIIKDKIDKIDEILFSMVREAILRAISHSLIISMLIILPSIAPLYLITGFMTRQITEKSK